MKRLGFIACGALIAACGGPSEPEEGPPPLYNYASMEQAMAEARETLPVFWDAFESDNPDYSYFALNVTTVSKRYTQEHVWLVDIRHVNDGQYAGVIPQEHEIEDGLTPGDMIAFLPEHIADWRYKEDGRFRGSYTLRAMLDLAPNADTSNIRATFHDRPVP